MIKNNQKFNIQSLKLSKIAKKNKIKFRQKANEKGNNNKMIIVNTYWREVTCIIKMPKDFYIFGSVPH